MKTSSYKICLKKLIAPATVLLLIAAVAGGVHYYDTCVFNAGIANERLYAISIMDSISADRNEIKPLVTLPKNKPVILASWHSVPDVYNKKSVILSRDIWVFSLEEMERWYKKNSKNITNKDLRFKQLLGLPNDSDYTHFSVFEVNSKYVLRPAYISDATENNMTTKLSDKNSPEFNRWFADNTPSTYTTDSYPWTRLGYTYDWADNGTDYGLTEFIVKKGTKLKVKKTITTNEFAYWLDGRQ